MCDVCVLRACVHVCGRERVRGGGGVRHECGVPYIGKTQLNSSAHPRDSWECRRERQEGRSSGVVAATTISSHWMASERLNHWSMMQSHPALYTCMNVSGMCQVCAKRDF